MVDRQNLAAPTAEEGRVMTPERWQQVCDILEKAVELVPERRPAFLDRACDADPSLRREVEALLASSDDMQSSFLRALPRQGPTASRKKRVAKVPPQENSPDAAPGAGDSGLSSTETIDAGETAEVVIGRYHLVHRIGEGGMGEVWLAEQKEPVRRRVALKLIKAGMNTREVMVRFNSERQALALMDHPAIAKVLDAGSTPEGAPYFVMEYIAGAPITVYCDNHRLITRERLELFMHVCEGVQHAHQKAIIHRDLKPSNVLVTEVDGHAAPKIIDFGVAKALTQVLTADTMFTHVGTMIGTPQYMSPEQAKSSGEDIDTRTDVYSLGIIFYELLAGSPPIDLQNIELEEFLRRLREEEPSKPSTKIQTQDVATSTEVARKRRSEPLALAKQMRGELDVIAMKALEKERSRRYASPSDFAADIARYLRNEAVLAVPPSVAYRARKFARRYRAALATAAAFVLVLIAAAVVSIRQSIRANREAAVAQAVNDFLQNDLLAQASAVSQSGPSTKPDPDLKVRTALDRAAARIGGKFPGQPEVEASIRDTLGQTYMDLGLYPEARTQLEQALDLHRRALGEKNPKTLKTMSALGSVAYRQGKLAEAETLLSQVMPIQRRVLGPEHPDTLRTMNNLGNVYDNMGKFPKAEALHSQVLEIRRRVLGSEHRYTLMSMNNLADVYLDEGKDAQAEALDSQVLEIGRRVLGPEHPDTLMSMNNLANVYVNQGKYAQADALYSETLELQRRVLGPEHPDTLRSMYNLAGVYDAEGKFAQAEALHSQALQIRRRLLGPEHFDTVASMNDLAGLYVDQGKYAQAEALLGQVLEIRRRLLGSENLDTLISMGTLAYAYTAQGKYAQAEPLFNQTVAIAGRALGPEHPATLSLLSSYALMYQRQGNYSLAEAYASQALAGRRHALGQEVPDTLTSQADVVLAYVSQGKFAGAEPLARATLETEKRVRPDDWSRFRAESLLGASLAGRKKYAEAEPLLLEGYQGMLARKNRIDAPDRYHLQLAHQWLVQLYKDWGKRHKAAEMAKESDLRLDDARSICVGESECSEFA
jgi:eukaryotic-like serine/threonine-protein kinase